VNSKNSFPAGTNVAGAIFTAPAGNTWNLEIKDRKWK
jgi:hypothetical protein